MERQSAQVGAHQRCPGRLRPRLRQQEPAAVDAGRAVAVLDELPQVPAVPAAQVGDGLAGLDLRQLQRGVHVVLRQTAGS